MSLQRNYYEVLGLPPSATTDQIKKKYRELARKYHPDIAQDKAFSQRLFTQINQAYRVLADPERRAQYNNTLDSPIRPAAPAPPSAGSSPVQSSDSAAPRASQPAPQAAAASPQKMQAIALLQSNAENAIMAGKPLEARGFCLKVLEADPKNLRALVLMGDALVMMGKPEDAAVQYRNALQLGPSSMIQAKLNRLEQAAPSNKTRDLTSKTTLSETGGGKSGGLFGRLLGRK